MLAKTLIFSLYATGSIAAQLRPRIIPSALVLKRQFTEGTCADQDEKDCGSGCIEFSATCCPDEAGGCSDGTFCDKGDNGEYGCCPDGETCTGDGGAYTNPGDIVFQTDSDDTFTDSSDSFTDSSDSFQTDSGDSGDAVNTRDSFGDSTPTRTAGGGLPIQTTNIDDFMPTLTLPDGSVFTDPADARSWQKTWKPTGTFSNFKPTLTLPDGSTFTAGGKRPNGGDSGAGAVGPNAVMGVLAGAAVMLL